MMGHAAMKRIATKTSAVVGESAKSQRGARRIDRGEGLPAARSPPGTMPAGAEWKIRRTPTPTDLPPFNENL
jgi:hypothetical protein